MNTNRSSYLLGAALGSALVLAVCAPAMAADIYDGGLKGGYDVPPPPPTDRGIYFKGYVGQANADVGNIWTEGFDDRQLHRCTTRTSSRARCSVSASAGRPVTGCASTSPVNTAATPCSSRQDSYPARRHRPCWLRTNITADIRAGWASPTPTSTWATGAASRPYIGAGIGFATLTVDGMKDVNVADHDSVAYGTDQDQHQLRLRLLRRRQLRRDAAVGRSISPTATPTSARRRAARSRRSTAQLPISGVFIQRHHLQRCDARRALQVPARSRRLSAGEVSRPAPTGATHEISPGPSAGPAFTAPASIAAA